jgi:hypothetical protein
MIMRHIERASDLGNERGKRFHDDGLQKLLRSLPSRELLPFVILSFADFVSDDATQGSSAHCTQSACGRAAQAGTDGRAFFCRRPSAASGYGKCDEDDRELAYSLHLIASSVSGVAVASQGSFSIVARRYVATTKWSADVLRRRF